MDPILTESQRDELRLGFTTAGFSMEDAMARLTAHGYEPEEARGLIVLEYKLYKREMFERTVKKDESKEWRKVMFLFVTIISIIGPVANITSGIWYIVACGLCGFLGYLAYKDKPIAGIIGGILVPIAFIFSYAFYFADRTSYIKIEMAIPLLLAFLPSVLVFFVISKLFYNEAQNEYE
jgi:hypothetical protein